jgi:DNA-binding NarL/FixJ family response regulator
MDVRMPVMGGLEATRQIKMELPDIRILMLTMSEDDADLFAAIKCGAQGYLLKNTSVAQLFRSIEGAVAGEAPISGVMAAKMLAELARPAKVASERFAPESLSDREQEVLRCLATGLSNREIAEKLVISENTVKKHLRNVLAKLHVENRVQAALLARQREDRGSR